MIISLVSFSATAVPTTFLKQHYQTNPESKETWFKSESPELIYKVCLDKPTSKQESIVVMCANESGTDDDNPDGATGYYDIWYLDGDKSTANTQETGGYDREVQAVLAGKYNWSVVLTSGYSTQGYTQESKTYYMKFGKNIIDVATLPVSSDNSGVCDPEDKEEACLEDDLQNQIQFVENDSDFSR